MVITQDIPSLVGGMSEQPHAMRMSDQCDLLLNMLPTLSQGVIKRPPSYIKKIIGKRKPKYAQIHVIQRDQKEQYITLFIDGKPKILDIHGKEYKIHYDRRDPYLKSNEDLAFVTIHDTTFIVNKNVETKINPNIKATKQPYEALVFLKNVSYDSKYTLKIDHKEITALTPRVKVTPSSKNNGQPSVFQGLAPETVLDALKNKIITTCPNMQVETYGPVMRIRHKDKNQDFSIEALDSEANTQLYVFKGSTRDFHKLPAQHGYHGFTLKIDPDPTTNHTSYFVRYCVDRDQNKGVGVWRECVCPDTHTHIDTATMPRIMQRLENGDFKIQHASWKNRRAGDEESNPNPAFIGSKIRDIFVYRNRLGFLCDDQVILSKSDDYFDFFRFTTTTYKDTQPITIAASHSAIARLNFAVPYMRNMLVFSDFGVFVLESGELCTPRTTSLAFLNAHKSLAQIRPVLLGSFVYFPSKVGSYSRLQEYGMQNPQEGEHYEDISAHVPELIKGKICAADASETSQYLVGQSDKEKNKLVFYKPFWLQGQKVQSAFGIFEFELDTPIYAFAFLGDTLWMLLRFGDHVLLETLDLSEKNSHQHVFLDHQYKLTMSKTRYTIESNTTSAQTQIFIHKNTQIADEKGRYIPHKYNRNVFHIKNDRRKDSLIIGNKYKASYRFSKLYLRDGNNTRTNGKTMLQRFLIMYRKTKHFVVQVKANNQYMHFEFSGKRIGENEIKSQEGQFPMPVRGDTNNITIEIFDKSPYSMQLLAASFKAKWVRK